MLRITEIKLSLLLATDMGHSNAEVKAAILKKLSLPEADLIGFTIFKRGVDARKRNAILLAYIVDCEAHRGRRSHPTSASGRPER